MNRVVNVEIAGQVFWIDEYAFETLHAYLNEIRKQLADDEGADEILEDIELRLAELLYAFNSNNKRAITPDQIDAVIDQVGYIDSESNEEIVERETPRKSYLDPRNRIIGGVCAGLSMKMRIPAFFIRLLFIALIFAFGLGIVLYLILWLSLESNTSRNAALASQGKPRTARLIASVEEARTPAGFQIQRIIFLPFTLIGYLLQSLGKQLRKWNLSVTFIFKTIFAGVLLFFSILLCTGLFYLNETPLFPRSITWLLNVSALYLMVLGLAIFFLEDYLPRPGLKVGKKLKTAAILPVFIIIIAGIYITNEFAYQKRELNERDYPITGNQLILDINSNLNHSPFPNFVSIQFRPKESEDDHDLSISIDYTSYGSDEQNAIENIQGIEYLYSFNENTLTLNNYFTLEKETYFRNQVVNVVLEIPQGMRIQSSHSLRISHDMNAYFYQLAGGFGNKGGFYVSSGGLLHELDGEFRNRVSYNEKSVLLDKFCQEFFIRDVWSCRSNIHVPLRNNWFFDKAFEDDMEIIEQIRKYLMPSHSLMFSNLKEINELTGTLKTDYLVNNKFQQYLEQLIKIKSEQALYIN